MRYHEFLALIAAVALVVVGSIAFVENDGFAGMVLAALVSN